MRGRCYSADLKDFAQDQVDAGRVLFNAAVTSITRPSQAQRERLFGVTGPDPTLKHGYACIALYLGQRSFSSWP